MKPITQSLLLLALFFGIHSVCTANSTIVIKGSDTLGAKMVPQLAEAFKANIKKLEKNIDIENTAERSSTGVASIIDATSEIGMSSREPKAKEIAKAQSKGVDMKAITVAKDGLAIVVHESSPLESISLEAVSYTHLTLPTI